MTDHRHRLKALVAVVPFLSGSDQSGALTEALRYGVLSTFEDLSDFISGLAADTLSLQQVFSAARAIDDTSNRGKALRMLIQLRPLSEFTDDDVRDIIKTMDSQWYTNPEEMRFILPAIARNEATVSAAIEKAKAINVPYQPDQRYIALAALSPALGDAERHAVLDEVVEFIEFSEFVFIFTVVAHQLSAERRAKLLEKYATQKKHLLPQQFEALAPLLETEQSLSWRHTMARS